MKKLIILILAVLCLSSCLPQKVNYTLQGKVVSRGLSVRKVEKKWGTDLAIYYIGTDADRPPIRLIDTLGRFQVGDKIDFCVKK